RELFRPKLRLEMARRTRRGARLLQTGPAARIDTLPRPSGRALVTLHPLRRAGPLEQGADGGRDVFDRPVEARLPRHVLAEFAHDGAVHAAPPVYAPGKRPGVLDHVDQDHVVLRL